jgi:hypothetical protein
MRQEERLATASLLLGPASLPCGLCCAPLLFAQSLGGIVTGVVALSRLGSAPHPRRGRGIAVTGIVVSLLGPAGYVLLIIGFGVVSWMR